MVLKQKNYYENVPNNGLQGVNLCVKQEPNNCEVESPDSAAPKNNGKLSTRLMSPSARERKSKNLQESISKVPHFDNLYIYPPQAASDCREFVINMLVNVSN